MESFSTVVNSFQLETGVIELSILVFTRVLASPLLFEFDFLFIQNDVQAFLFTDLLLFAKAKKNGDKLRIIRQPYRLNKIVLHATKDPGAFILVYVNEYGILVTAFTLVVGVNEYTKWKEAIDKAKVRVRLFFPQFVLIFTQYVTPSLYPQLAFSCSGSAIELSERYVKSVRSQR